MGNKVSNANNVIKNAKNNIKNANNKNNVKNNVKNNAKLYIFPIMLVVALSVFIQFVPRIAYANPNFPITERDRAYIYKLDSDGLSAVPIPDPYQYKREVKLLCPDGTYATNPVDMFVAGNRHVYILDSDKGRILVYDGNLNSTRIIEKFYLNGQESPLNKPEGIFVSGDGLLYIADTGNKRIIKADMQGNILLVIEKPQDVVAATVDSFLPVKLVVDGIGRISVVARNINMGIMQFDSNGNFMGYTGAPRVRLTAMDRFWRMISTRAQREQMAQFVPTEYNNLKIDDKGFLWGTISSLSAEEINDAISGNESVSPIKKINSAGKDVLKKKGAFPPVGDIIFLKNPSKIIDVALGPGKIYSLLDSSEGKIFTYNDEGNLLYVFGRIGNNKGNFERPIAIDYLEDRILVLDNALSSIMVFEPTVYGRTILDAIQAYIDGNYSIAYSKWSEVAAMNTNFQYAFIGLGKAKMDEGQYEQALHYFEYAGYREGYSQAKEMLRKERLQEVFPFIFFTIAGLLLYVFIKVTVRKLKLYIDRI